MHDEDATDLPGPPTPAASKRRNPQAPDPVEAYLRGIDEPGQSTLRALRRTILEIVPGAEEVISYGMPAFRVDGKTVAGFAAFKSHLSYLPFSGSVLPHFAEELAGYTMTKSALHFPIDRPLPTPLVRRLVELRLDEIRSRSRSQRH